MTGEFEVEDRIYNRLVKGVFQSQLLLTLVVGLAFFGLSLVAAHTMIDAALEEIRAILHANRCTCSQRDVRSEASGNTVSITPDVNSVGQHAREILQKQGHIQ